jgi:3-oxoadipate enol-lactonase
MAGNDGQLHAVRRGRGPSVVLLHGWACSHTVWTAVIDRLGDAYDSIALDLPGFGVSARLDGAFSLADLATAVDNALESSGVTKAVVVGHSMGGMVAQHLYAKAPERVRGLVLCGTTSASGPAYQQTTQQLRELIDTQGSAALAAAMGPGLFGDQYRRTHAAQVEEFVAEVAACDADTLTAALDAIEPFDLTDRLGHIAVPCAVVVGDVDPFLEDCRLLAGSIGGASLSLVDGVGHMEPMESPDEVAAAIEGIVRTAGEHGDGQ